MIGLERGHALITMAIVSTNYLVRLGLQTVIKTRAHIQLIGEATSVAEAEELIAREKPHLVLVDSEGEINIRELVRKLKASVPTIKIILLGGIEDAQGTWQGLSSWIDGIVLSIQPPPALLATIDYVCHGQAKTIPDELNGTGRLNGMALGISNAGPSSLRSSDTLTKREREIIDLIGQGLPNKDIADRLCICSTTVRHHLTSIFDKLGVTSRQKLLIRAHQHGLVEFRTFA
ncbi:MAG: response regulator transcription factor [Nitrospira defluvii]|nr:response regulator transcription factor [Nitrospira defluvii]